MTRFKERLAGAARGAPVPVQTPDQPRPPSGEPNGSAADLAPAAGRAPTPVSRPVLGRPVSTADDTGNRLIVGRQIRLKGEIAACDRLVVEGHVETTIETAELQVLPGGVFIGGARVDRADVRGRVDGSLVARERLTIHDGGVVAGEIRYGRVVIEDGGILTGDIARLTEDDGGENAVPAAVSATSRSTAEKAEGDT